MNIKVTHRQFMLYGEGIVHIELEEEDHMLDEVLIVSGRIQNVKSVQLGMEKLQPALLKNIPTAMGEVDVLKMIQTPASRQWGGIKRLQCAWECR